MTPSVSATRSAVLAAVLAVPVTDRQRIMAETGLSQATVFRAIDELVASGIVKEGERLVRLGPGRQPAGLSVDGAASLVCGVDLGGTNCRLILADATSQPIARSRQHTPRGLTSRELADWIADRIHALVRRYGDGSPLRAVGVGLPGVYSVSKKTVMGSVNLGEIRGTAFVRRLEEAVDVPAAFDNDSNLALLGEQEFGAVSGPGTKALLVLGTGLSGAVSMGGHVVTGTDGLLGEFGRLPLPGASTRLRDLLSGAGLLALARDRGYELNGAADVFAHPDRFGTLVNEVDNAFFFLISLVALAYEPQTVYVAGGFSESYGETALAEIAARIETEIGVRTDLRRSTLGNGAGLLGAMTLGLSTLYQSMGLGPEQISRMSEWKQSALDRFDSCSVDSDQGHGPEANVPVGVGQKEE